jgi:molecular chaperone DnaJ
MSEDYYKILGVSRDASEIDIKKAFRRLAHQHHPDKGGDEKMFHKINEAYQVLSNKKKRKQYDQFGGAFEGMGQGGFPGGNAGFDFGSFRQEAQNAGRASNFDNLGDIFEEFFGAGMGRRKDDIRRGDDIQIDTEVDLKDVLSSQKREFSIYKYEVCSRCNGTGAEPGVKIKQCPTCRGEGQVQQMKKTIFGTITHSTVCPACGGEGKIPEKVCNVCKGDGRVKKDEKIAVVIPAGIDSGQVLKIKGAGDAGKKNGPAGDLYLRVFVKKHPIFERKVDDLYTTTQIQFSDAVLGGEIEIPSLENNKEIFLKVPAGTISGKMFRISNKGIPRFSSYGMGDLYVKVKVNTPKRLTKKQKNLLKELRKEGL